MDPVTFENIPWRLDADDVFRKIRVDPAAPDAGQVRRLIDAAHAVGRPKALHRESYIDARTDDTVVIDGLTFTSRVLRVNTGQAHRVFAYLATCGMELADWARSLDDMLERFWSDGIMELALRKALGFLNEKIAGLVPQTETAVMNPGSLPDWPVTQQRPLFDLIGSAAGDIGITLTDSMLMVPAKSVSGIRFPTEARFENCQLCPREVCPGRRAPYDKELYQRKYAPHGT
jgi:hypothetical protein